MVAKLHHIGIRVTEDQYAAIKQFADFERRTVSDLCREAIEGMAQAAALAVPNIEASKTPEGRKAALEALQRQALEFSRMGEALAVEYEAVKALLAADGVEVGS